MKLRILSAVLIVLITVFPCSAKLLHFDGLVNNTTSSEGTKSLDGLTRYADGTMAVGTSGDRNYTYQYDATIVIASDNSPSSIVPDNNTTGTGAWVLIPPGQIPDDECHLYGEDNDLQVCWDSAAGLWEWRDSNDVPMATFDPSNGRFTPTQVGSAGFPNFELLTYDPSDGRPYLTDITGDTHTLVTAELKNTLINNYTAGCTDKVFEMPVANYGWLTTFICGCSADITITPNGSEQYEFNQATMAGGESVVATSCTIGSSVTFYSYAVGASTYAVKGFSSYSDFDEETPP